MLHGVTSQVGGRDMHVERAAAAHADEWAELRAALWPSRTVAQHRADLSETFLTGNADVAAFIAVAANGEPVGFSETALRRDYVNGCETSPVVFLEGIYVRPDARRARVARKLCDAVAEWGRARGCTEFASDAGLDNLASHAFHRALGSAETQRVVYFRKLLSEKEDA